MGRDGTGVACGAGGAVVGARPAEGCVASAGPPASQPARREAHTAKQQQQQLAPKQGPQRGARASSGGSLCLSLSLATPSWLSSPPAPRPPGPPPRTPPARLTARRPAPPRRPRGRPERAESKARWPPCCCPGGTGSAGGTGQYSGGAGQRSELSQRGGERQLRMARAGRAPAQCSPGGATCLRLQLQAGGLLVCGHVAQRAQRVLQLAAAVQAVRLRERARGQQGGEGGLSAGGRRSTRRHSATAADELAGSSSGLKVRARCRPFNTLGQRSSRSEPTSHRLLAPAQRPCSPPAPAGWPA